MTARQLGTLFTTNIKLALQLYVGRWCMNLKALLYATFNLCMLFTERFHHNWQVYMQVYDMHCINHGVRYITEATSQTNKCTEIHESQFGFMP